MKRKRYFVRTWDSDKQSFTPQKGVRVGPYTLMGLRKALRQLQGLGYDTSRAGGVSILVEDEENYRFEKQPRKKFKQFEQIPLFPELVE